MKKFTASEVTLCELFFFFKYLMHIDVSLLFRISGFLQRVVFF